MKDDRLYWLWLSGVEGVGSVTFRKLVKIFGSPQAVFKAPAKVVRETAGLDKHSLENILTSRKSFDGSGLVERLTKKGITTVILEDDNYPRLLKEIYDPPPVLYVWGELLARDEIALAVVGARKMTMYGRTVTESLVSVLSASGLTIVSGLAKGVDGTAHRAAIESGGRTIAVLGGGIFNIYPPEHVKLAEQIAQGSGAVVSEFAPDLPSVPGNFPSRNRIIAGLSLGVLVTEAAIDSGSLITARSAVEGGREVFAVPGPITSPLAEGPSSLIQTGAKLVFRATDVLEELNIEERKEKEKARSTLPISSQEAAVLQILELEAKHIDQIVRESGRSAADISSTIALLELKGLVREIGVAVWAKA